MQHSGFRVRRGRAHPSTSRFRQLVGWGAALALASGCDFTPVLDIPLPAHDQRIVMQSILVADSTVGVSVTLSEDPYSDLSPEDYEASRERLATTAVELAKDGQTVETLTRRRCIDEVPGYVPSPDDPDAEARCGPFRSTVRVAAGATYTVRARVEGLQEATATVTVPARVDVSEVTASGGDGVSFRLRDPAGEGHQYAVQLSPVRFSYSDTYRDCAPPDYTVCRDTTVTYEYVNARRFQTSDPFLIAASRVPATNALSIVTFDDQAFDGAELALSLDPEPVYRFGEEATPPSGGDALWLIALDETTYQAYQVTYLSLGEDNPFAEPSNLPSNVAGGYGLVGAATIHARPLPASSARREGG